MFPFGPVAVARWFFLLNHEGGAVPQQNPEGEVLGWLVGRPLCIVTPLVSAAGPAPEDRTDWDKHEGGLARVVVGPGTRWGSRGRGNNRQPVVLTGKEKRISLTVALC